MAAKRTNKYERYYQESREVCGQPFPEIIAFFETYGRAGADVLDLGCGQGRDALLAARHRHRVLGVDLSETGIAQMIEDAQAEGLDVEGVVADIATWQTEQTFDIVLLDRVLHLLATPEERQQVLERACACTRTGGYVLIADTPTQKSLLDTVFDALHPEWTVTLRRNGLLFARHAPSIHD